MRVLAACSLGGAGHLQPLLPFLRAARRRGDETLVVGPPALTEMVELAGFPFHAGGEPPEADIAPIRERLAVVAPLDASILANRDLFGRLATAAMLPGMERICADWRPDLVLRDPCEYASAVVAGRLGIPSAQVAISLADVEAGSIVTATPALEAHRPGLVDELRASPYLTRFPASLDPSPFPATVRFQERRAETGEPLPDWWDGPGAPLVYVSFGTVLGHMTFAADAYRAALRAVDGLAVRVLLTVGRRFDPSVLGPIPANVRVEPWVEQDRVFDEADLVVCHGGSGTAFGALAVGIPQVVVPFFADQFENGRRIVASGAGVMVETEHAHLDAARVTEGITTVLGTPSFRQRARLIADEMLATPTVDEVLAKLQAGRTEVVPSRPANARGSRGHV
jgi:UDP:flavonoid glycosyltransferase YjiC (YdhE family)